MGFPADLMEMYRKRAFLPAVDYESGGIGVSRDEGFAPDLDTGMGGTTNETAADSVARRPLVAAAPKMVGHADERSPLLDELSAAMGADERATLNDPRASASAQAARNNSDDITNLFLMKAGAQPLPRRDDPYVSERDKMRDWLMKRGGVAQNAERNSLNAERTKAYLDSVQAARERDLAAKQARAEAEGRKADAEAHKREFEAEKMKSTNAFRERELGLKERAEKRKTAPKTPAAPGSNSKDATALRKEFNQLPEVKSYKETVTSYEKIRRAAQNPSAAGDMSLIFAFMKVLDPGSTVREGEFAAAQAAAGGDQRILSALEKVRSGQRLTPEQRADFVSQAERLFASQRVNYDAARSMYRGLAEEAKLNPDHVTGPEEGGSSKTPSKTSGKVLVTNGAESLEIDADDLEDAERDGYRRVP